MARAPTSVEIRVYQVGFGDCFLLSFVYGANDRRHVLIDFGSTKLPGRAKAATANVGGRKAKTEDDSKPTVWMPKVARDIAAVCGKHGLTAVVATHRHADHISGFATAKGGKGSGDIIRALKPKLVLQPWTEDPAAAKDAKQATRDSSRSRKSVVAGLQAMHRIADTVAALAAKNPVAGYGSAGPTVLLPSGPISQSNSTSAPIRKTR